MPNSITLRQKPGRSSGKKNRAERRSIPDRESVLAPFAVRGSRDVQSYLAANPDVIPLLREAPGRLSEHFGPIPKISLEMFVDPEGSAENKQLWVVVRCTDDPDEALRMLRKIDA